MLHGLEQVLGHVDGDVALAVGPGLLGGDLEGVLQLAGVVGVDLALDAILERGDDRAAVRVVLGVGGEGHEDIDGEADGEAADLDVTFFHDVQQADLDAWGEIGQLVDAEDAAVGAGDDAVVDHFLAGVVEPKVRGLDGVDVADEVGHRDIGGGELFLVALLAVDPLDGGVVAVLLDPAAHRAGDGVEGVLVDGGAGEDGHPLVEEVGELAGDAGFRLAAEAEQDEIVAGQQGVDDLGDDGFLVADDPLEERAVLPQSFQQVLTDLVFDRSRTVPRSLQFTDRARQRLSHDRSRGSFTHCCSCTILCAHIYRRARAPDLPLGARPAPTEGGRPGLL